MTHFVMHLHTTPITKTSTFSTLSCSLKPQKNPINISKTKTIIPARDRVIDFGRHKGKMLGTLPSSYLKWVSKNLRARDFEQWAKVADQVLEDPVYKDRIEWEFAESVLTGDNTNINNSNLVARNETAVSKLLELSERFGWDNEDKVGWSKVNFELLGTSKGGRIPRILGGQIGEKEKDFVKVEKEEKAVCGGGSGGLISESEERRRERRMRVKEKEKEKTGHRDNKRGKFGNGNVGSGGGGGGGGGVRNEKSDQDLKVEINNPFPGREALLKKVLSRRRFL